MSVLSKIFPIKIKFASKEAEQLNATTQYSYWSGENMVPFDGEKTPYELGTPKSYYLEYYWLRTRSWEAFTTSDVVHNAIKKYCLWIVGSGLKLQTDPQQQILKNNNINVDSNDFSSNIESYFRLYVKLKESTYSQEMNLHGVAWEALKNAMLSGDVLCVLRLNNKKVNIEIIDGYYVQDPIGSEHYDKLKEGHRISYGVELDKKDSHVAYYVSKGNMQYERIKAKGSRTGRRQAWLFYGLRYKTNHVRGMSLLTAVLETVSKIDRYKDATLGSAEENAKVIYTIEHGMHSDGENPMIQQLAQSMAKGKGIAPETNVDQACETIATKVAQSTSKNVYNMPVDSQLKRNDFETDLNFPQFFATNKDVVYSCIGIPPEVADDKFEGSYSGSRAALKSWEYKMMTDRTNLMEEQFYKPFYNFWLDIFVLSNQINIDGYLEAFMTKDFMVLAAFRNCRFIGATVPHIDPFKEVNAERLKLGSVFKDVPLTTPEQACEALNTGDYQTILNKSKNDKELSEEFIMDDTANDSSQSE